MHWLINKPSLDAALYLFDVGILGALVEPDQSPAADPKTANFVAWLLATRISGRIFLH